MLRAKINQDLTRAIGFIAEPSVKLISEKILRGWLSAAMQEGTPIEATLFSTRGRLPGYTCLRNRSDDKIRLRVH